MNNYSGRPNMRVWNFKRNLTIFLCTICACFGVATIVYLLHMDEGERKFASEMEIDTSYIIPQADTDETKHNELSFVFNINEENLCDSSYGDTVDILVGIFSAPGEFKERKIVRKTWGTAVDVNPKIRLMFMLGVSSESDFDVDALKSESTLYRDIVQADYKESYRKLVLKSFALFQWADHYCGDAKFVLKVDSDIRINVTQLLNRIHSKRMPDTFLCGYVIKNAPVVRNRDSKFVVAREEYSSSTYPTYCVGCAFIVSRRIVKKISGFKIPEKVFPVDDAYTTGILRQEINELIDTSVIWFNSDRKEKDKELPYVKVNVLP